MAITHLVSLSISSIVFLAFQGLQIIDLQMNDYLRILENAIQFGYPVLLQNVQEYLDPTLNPVLNKSVARIGQGPGLWWGWAETSEVGPMAGKREVFGCVSYYLVPVFKHTWVGAVGRLSPCYWIPVGEQWVSPHLVLWSPCP